MPRGANRPRGIFSDASETARLKTLRLLLIALLAAISPLLVHATETEPGEPAAGTVVTLLGTGGGPGGKVGRAGIASLVTVGGTRYLIDAGEGVARQLARAGVPEPEVSTVFLTHLHDDHTAGLPALVTFAHTLRSKGMTLIGPPGTNHMLDGLLAFQGVNAEIRMAEQRGRLADPKTLFAAREVGTGLVFSDDRVKVTAVENTHYHIEDEAVSAGNRSYSYRFEMPDRTIVFTGDTGPSAAVEQLARGADTLVAEMVSASDIARVPPFVVEHMLQEHLTAAEVGKLAAKADVGMLVLSHIGTVDANDVAEIRRHFGGRIEVGEDLASY